jgi:hypothetical protein
MHWRWLQIVVRSVLLLSAGVLRAEILLPGTQPLEHDFKFRDVADCYKCHSRTTNGVADPYFSWQGGMMAQAARDPVFRAALAVANQDIPEVGEFCIRCHSPRGWLEGASKATNGGSLTNDYLHGVSCDVCHHLVDPLSEEAKKLVKQVPPGYGNGMIVVDPGRTLRGPYGEPTELKMHATMQSAYHASGELCGNCHNVSNPTLAIDSTNQAPHLYGHIERTYSEWALSDFAKKENPQSCQFCHFPQVPGGGLPVNYVSKYGESHRDHFVSHNAVGGSTWVQDAVYLIWKGKDVDRAALDAGKARARELLKTAAELGLECAGGKARITITNRTGHKLPTGYPEGRRMWMNVRFVGAGDKPLAELGRYGEKDDSLNRHGVKGQADRATRVKAPTLLDPESTRVYECKPGISKAQGAKYSKAEGPSFHFILNDVITKDNRIPPRGFRKEAFKEHLAAPVGANYADGQFWDEMEFAIPTGTERVEVRVMYQSVSWEYLKFLVEENQTNSWGNQLYEAWEVTGKCPPEEIAFITKPAGP